MPFSETSRFRPSEADIAERVLGSFTPEQRSLILERQQILSSLAYFIGKDFAIPVELNEPGEGWHWDFKENVIRIDPKDLLEKSMEYLRFVISHEAGHRRISRMDFIPNEEWGQPGFAFMENAIEDPRDNNFVAEAYPKFSEQMALAYQTDLDFENKAKATAKKKLGKIPRFVQAGFEYIKQWFRESQDQPFEVDATLPDDVRAVIEKTLPHAQDSWLRYPSREEANESEEVILNYAKKSYKINRNEIWPHFKALVEEDLKDQELQEAMKDGPEPGSRIPKPLSDSLTPEERDALEGEIEKAMAGDSGQESHEGAGKGPTVPIDIDSLSEGIKKKIREYVDGLPEGKKQELRERAARTFKEVEDEINADLEGKLAANPDRPAPAKEKPPDQDAEETATTKPQPTPESAKALEDFREAAERALETDETVYERERQEVLPIIDRLEQDLRQIFQERRLHKWRPGNRTGKRISITKRIQEKVKKVSAVESKAWEKREHPAEKDYAIQLLVDLSSSMHGEKIAETFKAVIVLAESLNRLSIATEVIGFNDRLYDYQTFGEPMSPEVRRRMSGMPEEVLSDRAAYNDDGWALQEVSKRLGRQKADKKILIVLSDGIPVESARHSGSQYALAASVAGILKDTDQKLIGLGIGRGTKHVEKYYPLSIADVPVEEMAEKIADLLRAVVEDTE